MRNFILVLVLSFASVRCAKALPEVHFEWYNLSPNEIWITDVVGLPHEASPGRLMPCHAEDQLEVKESIFSETVQITDRITILWKDNGKNGWQGGLKIPGSIPPGEAHQFDLKRVDSGIPPKLNAGKVRFTYLGNDKWRIIYFGTH